ncbi:MAG TPA: FAD binding domain-containing protein [Conexibacter sp.]|nr:FAD binding domain-containing protein [Conexibacter sp.]
MTAIRYTTTYNPKLRDFDVVAPASVQEAVALHGGVAEAEYLGGGTALLSTRYARKLQPELLVNLKGLPELHGVRRGDGVLSIGSLCRLNALTRDPDVLSVAPAVAQGCGTVGAYQVRNRGTIGGNVCNGASVADLVAPLLACDATAVYADGRRETRVPATSLWREPNDTAVPRVSVLVRLELPERAGWTSAFAKTGLRRALEIGMVNVAVALARDGDGRVTDARVAVTGMNMLPFRATDAEGMLVGAAGDELDARAREAGRVAADGIRPLEAREDFRVSRHYQARVLPAIVARTAAEAAQQPFTTDGKDRR